MYIFPLNPKKHAGFLKQERKDPITGDAFKAGDEVVFCAACRSAFLRESWEFMEGKHCNQKETLESFPKAQKALTLQRLRNKRWYPSYFFDGLLTSKKDIISTLKLYFGANAGASLFFFIAGGAENLLSIFSYTLKFTTAGFCLMFGVPVFFSLLQYVYDNYIAEKYLSIHTKKIIFAFYRKYKAKDIQHLQFTLLKRVAKKDILQFTLLLKNNEEVYIEREIHGEDAEVNAVLEGLAIFSKYAPVTVSIQHQREYDFLLEKKAQYQAPIEIEILE